MTETYETDRDGFPIVTCSKCGGAKTIRGFSHVLNGVCFKCGGAGAMHLTRKVAELASRYRNAVRSATTCSMTAWVAIAADGSREYVNGVEVGDRVRADKGEPWRTVTAVKPTRRVIGHGIVGAGDSARFVSMTLETLITFDDGETITGWGIQWKREPNREQLAELRDKLVGEAVASLPRRYKR